MVNYDLSEHLSYILITFEYKIFCGQDLISFLLKLNLSVLFIPELVCSVEWPQRIKRSLSLSTFYEFDANQTNKMLLTKSLHTPSVLDLKSRLYFSIFLHQHK